MSSHSKKLETSDDSEVEQVEIKPKKSSNGKSKKSKNERSKKKYSDDESSVEEQPLKKKSKKTSKKEESDDDSEVEDVFNIESKKSSNSDQPSTSKGKKTKSSPKKAAKKSKYVPNLEKLNKPTKERKVNTTKYAPSVDPSSLVKDADHKYPFQYNGTTYWCKYLPDNFQEQWDGICEMRKNEDAPVDSIGACSLYDKNAAPEVQRYQKLISIIVSAQTNDEQTAKAMNNLKNYGLTVERMIKTDVSKIRDCIKNVSYNNNKAKFIKETSQILHDKYNNDVPRTKAEMMTLPGCALKVSNLAMACCWNEVVGIAIDTHMERILYRLKWSNEKKREKQLKDLESWMPKAMWADLNTKLVGFGQQICSSKSPKCDECLINSTCDYYATQF